MNLLLQVVSVPSDIVLDLILKLSFSYFLFLNELFLMLQSTRLMLRNETIIRIVNH